MTACILTWAVGTGAALSVFAVASGTLTRPTLGSGTDDIVSMSLRHEPSGRTGAMSYQTAAAVVRHEPHLFRGMALSVPMLASFVGEDHPEEFEGLAVSEDYFTVFALSAMLGRVLEPSDVRQHSPVIVLSRRLWQRRFGGDISIIGRGIRLDDTLYTVVGVADPPGIVADGIEFWATLDQSAVMSEPVGFGAANCFARLERAEFLVTAQDLVRQHSRAILDGLPHGDEYSLSLVPLVEEALWPYKGSFRFALLVSLLIFLSACASGTLLLLLTTIERLSDFGVRLSLGAGRRRLAAELGLEAFAIVLVGVVGGLALAAAAVRILRATWEGVLPQYADVVVDWRVGILAGALAAMGAGVMVLTAFTVVVRQAPTALLQHSGFGVYRGRGPASAYVFVAVETMLTMTLLALSMVAVGSLLREARAPIGLQPAHLFTGRLAPFRQYKTAAARAQFYAAALDEFQSLPGLQAAALTSHVPAAAISIPPRTMLRRTDVQGPPLQVQWLSVSDQYFSATQMPLIAGRDFTRADAVAGQPQPAIVNEALARTLSLDGSLRGAVGLPLTMQLSGDSVSALVVGVAANSPAALKRPVDQQIFLTNRGYAPAQMWVLVRTNRALPEITSALRTALQRVDKAQPVSDIAAMESLLAAQLRLTKARAGTVSMFALAAALLTALGVSALAAYGIKQRSREVGTRLALGARPMNVAVLIYRETALPIAVGTLAGGFLVWLTSSWLRSQIYGAVDAQAVTYVVSAVCAAVVPTAAIVFPVLQAVRRQPVRALESR